jgi:hypothetical protein
MNLTRSNRKNKKWKITGDFGTVHFGDSRYEDFTQHRDKERRRRYLERHRAREDWTETGIDTPGFWSRWLLWNKPTIEESYNHIINKFFL